MSWSVAILGLSITSAWGNGHATNYRALTRALAERGHRVTFLERDVPWYAQHRDLPDPPHTTTHLYGSLDELRESHTRAIADADLVVVGSYVPDGVAVGEWVTSNAVGVTAFYDIDTPVTMAKLERGDYEYLHPALIPRYDLYLSFTGGPLLEMIELRYGARAARAFYCVVDPDRYFPEDATLRWDLGYLGTYSEDRQPALEELLIRPALRQPLLRCVVVGPQYPERIRWPANVERVDHLEPGRHRAFYNVQRFTLNVTRPDMVRAGYSPSVRLFEAAACGVPVISDRWIGIDSFFYPGREILLADDAGEVVSLLSVIDEQERREIGLRARARVLDAHTAGHRVDQLEHYVGEVDRLRAPGVPR